MNQTRSEKLKNDDHHIRHWYASTLSREVYSCQQGE